MLPDELDSIERSTPPFRQESLSIWGLITGSMLGLTVTVCVFVAAPRLREKMGLIVSQSNEHPPVTNVAESTSALADVTRRVARMQTQLNGKIPVRPYLVVSTSDNRFRLMQGNEILREGVVSTGSYVQLEAEGGQQWVFRTPSGMFRIIGKTEKPVWNKPDWAFIEEGRAVPNPGSSERFERGVLGDYALGFGNGYLIHGTLYQRLLGLPVTHGCIRMGDDDLRAVYMVLQVGSPIYIY